MYKYIKRDRYICYGYTKFKAHCLQTRIFIFNISFLLVLFLRRQPSSSLIEPHSQSIEFQKCERRFESLLCACRLNSLAARTMHVSENTFRWFVGQRDGA